MTRYRAIGTMTVYLEAEFVGNDDGNDGNLAYQALVQEAMRASGLDAPCGTLSLEYFEPIQKNMGEIIKEKVTRARAWVMGRMEG